MICLSGPVTNIIQNLYNVEPGIRVQGSRVAVQESGWPGWDGAEVTKYLRARVGPQQHIEIM
jgi:hypothetical protein